MVDDVAWLERRARALAVGLMQLRKAVEALETARGAVCRERNWGCEVPLPHDGWVDMTEFYMVVGGDELKELRDEIKGIEAKVGELIERLDAELRKTVARMIVEQRKLELLASVAAEAERVEAEARG